MRRLISIAAFALMLTVPVWAQRGGGHGGGGFGGGHAGFSGGHAGFSGGHVSGGFGASHSFSHSPSFSAHSFSGRGVAHGNFSRGPFLHNGVRIRTYGRNGFRNNCYGYGYGCYGYPWWGYYDPWLWGDDSSYDQDYDQNLAIANQMDQQSLEEQQMRRQEEADGDQDLYTRPPLRPRSAPDASAQQGVPMMPDTILVFRDQHKQEIQNYAVVGQTLWSFAPQHTEKIPLSELDLAATMKANDAQGVSFRLPGSNEAQ